MAFKPISFKPNHNVEFYSILKERVNGYFKSKSISKKANFAMVFKSMCMLLMYFGPLVVLFFDLGHWWIYLLLWIVMGFGMAGVGLSIMHDANHGTYSKNQYINSALGVILNFLGGNDTNWRIQHNLLHHTYTNIPDVDEDIEVPGLLMRFTSQKKLYKIHRFQHIYAWFLYGLMTILWFLTKDYNQALRYGKKDLLKTQNTSVKRHLVRIIFYKIIYGFIFIVAPLLWSPASWYITLIGFLVMQFICGFVLAVIFQPAHVIPTSDFPIPNESGNIEADWAVSQLANTANFAPNSRLLSWYVGGLNYQIEHHLFPNICHIHYRKISEIVQQTAKEFNLPYHSYKTFSAALLDHGRFLYRMGQG